MKKNFTLLKMIFLAIFMVTGMNVSGQKSYQLITSDSELIAGDKYLVVGEKDGSIYYSFGVQNNNNRASVIVNVSADIVTATPATGSTDAINPFEITLGGSAGAWTFFDAVNNTYLRPRTGSNNGLQGNSSPVNWTISIATSGIATIIGPSTYERNVLRFNSSNTLPLFSCYSSSNANAQAEVYLYKEVTSTNAVSTPTFTPEAGTYYSPIDVTLTSETDEALIYYTTDGTEPDDTKTLYTTPISVNSTTTIKAIAYKDGMDPSAVSTAVYTFSSPVDMPSVIITEAYGGGGNNGAVYKNDFVELYNTSESDVEIGGWGVHYYAAGGVDKSTNIMTIPAGAVIKAGKYFLIQGAAGGANGTDLPTADATSTVNMSGSNGKVILFKTTEGQTIANDINSIINNVNFVDYLPYGSANPIWGDRLSAPSNSTSASRKLIDGGGNGNNIYVYTQNVGQDFEIVAPNPQNSGTTVGMENNQTEGTIITTDGNNIVVKAGQATTVYVYSVSGKLVATSQVVDGSVVIPATKGVYVVKTGNKVAKVIL